MGLFQQPVNNPVRGRSLRSNFLWAFWGNAINGICQWGILVVLARLGSPELVGKFTLGLTINTPIMIFAHMDLRSIQSTDAKDEFLFQHYFALTIVNNIFALLTVTVLAFLLGYRGELFIIILLVGLFKVAENVSFVFYGLFQQREMMKYVAFSLFLKSPLSLALIMVTLFMTHSLIIATGCFSFIWILFLFGYDLPAAKFLLGIKRLGMNDASQNDNINKFSLWPVFSKEHMTSMIWMAFPLGISLTLGSLVENIPRYFIEQTWGLYQLGIYSAMTYLIVIGGKFILTLLQSLIPRLSVYYADKKFTNFFSLFNKIILLFSLIGVIGIVISIFFGREVLSLIYGPVYAKQSRILVWIMIYAFILSFGGLGRSLLIIRRFTKTDMVYRLLAIICLIILCILLIPRMGLFGAVLAQLLSSTVYLIGCAATIFFMFREISISSKKSEPMLMDTIHPNSFDQSKTK